MTRKGRTAGRPGTGVWGEPGGGRDDETPAAPVPRMGEASRDIAAWDRITAGQAPKVFASRRLWDRLR